MWERSEFSPETIIWSADVPKAEIEAVIKAEALPKGTVIKLDRLFFETESKDFINFCEGNGYPVFCDAKIIEIPVKALKIAETYLAHKPFMLNIMAGACSTGIMDGDEEESQIDALRRFADLCNEANTRSCVVTVLTSKSKDIINYEFSATAETQVLKYAFLAKRAGITDIVCSPEETIAIRRSNQFNSMWLNTPGVRLPDSAKDDQQRVKTPKDALIAGANRLVIGRPLTGNPKDGNIVERIKRNYDCILENIHS